MARHVAIGQPAHDLEGQAIRFLVEGLPAAYTVYSNGWLVEPSGVIYEFDAVLVAPHGIYVVEMKCHAAAVKGNDHDWYMPSPVRSPLKLNRKTAQVLATRLRTASYEAGHRWVEHFVFLPYAASIDVTGLAGKGRVHGKATILGALQDAVSFEERSGRKPPPVNDHTRTEVERLLTGVDPKNPPPQRIREYRVLAVRERTERWVEYVVEHELLGAGPRRILRVYPPRVNAPPEQRARDDDFLRWEVEVLAQIGAHRFILRADAPFPHSGGFCLPLEDFPGITLGTWVDHRRTARQLAGKEGFTARRGVEDVRTRDRVGSLRAATSDNRFLLAGVVAAHDQATVGAPRVGRLGTIGRQKLSGKRYV